MTFNIGFEFAWNGKRWKITGFQHDIYMQKATIQEVNGTIKTTIDLKFLQKKLVSE